MDVELIATVTCPVCGVQRAVVNSLPATGNGVRYNVMEPEITECPVCHGPLHTERVK